MNYECKIKSGFGRNLRCATGNWPGGCKKASRGRGAVRRGDRGRYSTDASIYQIQPIGVVVPRTMADVAAALDIAREEGVPVLPRGGGTSQNGQTVGEALVVDVSRHLNGILDFDAEAKRVTVEPGIVLDRLNGFLRRHGLFFPVEPSTASRCTIGGMAGNNSCGARSLRYGKMVDNVLSLDAILPDGEAMRFRAGAGQSGRRGRIAGVSRSGAPGARHSGARGGRDRSSLPEGPAAGRRLQPGQYRAGRRSRRQQHGASAGGVGRDAGLHDKVELAVQPVPTHRVLGVCHFPTFRSAMVATKHLVELGPVAVELVDRNIIELGREIPQFRATLGQFVRGEPDSLLLVEFAGDDRARSDARPWAARSGDGRSGVCRRLSFR